MITRGLFNRRLRQLHLWLGLAIGAQVGLWLASGLFMTWFPIEQVRGEHLIEEADPQSLEWSSDLLPLELAIVASGEQASSARAQRLAGIPVWRIEGENGGVLIDARSGERLDPLPEELATTIAVGAWRGEGGLSAATLLQDPPREYGRPGPVWQVTFDGDGLPTLYVDAGTGDIKAVRTGLWRAFDFMWGLHIMDWSSRENFNSWWIRMTASLAVLFFLAGLGLAVLRISGMLRRTGR